MAVASMRPPEFTGGNLHRTPTYSTCATCAASRFNEAAGIHRRKPETAARVLPRPVASMRPPEFTGGNQELSLVAVHVNTASMRPPEFTGGNVRHPIWEPPDLWCKCFNEAAGIHRRKPLQRTGGQPHRLPSGFNEAAGIHRRKRQSRQSKYARRNGASMRPPEFTGGNKEN